ncbi:hypothetical protein ACFP81_02630 [Deinococcus lacus]|uniref:Lipoprotein n=1 Tax=Deinococcus lacus TaxID=392561 RepID=A0ABW1YDQ1_9DEIO
MPRLFLSAALITGLSACNSGPKAPEVDAAQPAATMLSGKVAGQTSGQIEYRAGERVLASAALDAAGTFSFPLPAETELNPGSLTSLVDGLTCSGLPSSSNVAAKYATLSELSLGGKTYIPAYLAEKGLLNRVVLATPYVYSTADTTLSGTVSCDFFGVVTGPATFNDVKLKKGWNLLYVRMDASLGLSGLSANASVRNHSNTAQSDWTEKESLIQQLKP